MDPRSADQDDLHPVLQHHFLYHYRVDRDMLKFKRGDLVHIIDDYGVNKGYGIYVDLLAPGSHTESDKELDTFWHFKIVDVKGEMKYLNTTLWSLIPADPDSCNP